MIDRRSPITRPGHLAVTVNHMNKCLGGYATMIWYKQQINVVWTTQDILSRQAKSSEISGKETAKSLRGKLVSSTSIWQMTRDYDTNSWLMVLFHQTSDCWGFFFTRQDIYENLRLCIISWQWEVNLPSSPSTAGKYCDFIANKQRVLMHRHQGWNVRHGLCHIYMRYLYIYELFIAFVCFVVCPLL